MHFHSWKCIWKCRLQNRGHFVSALGVLTIRHNWAGDWLGNMWHAITCGSVGPDLWSHMTSLDHNELTHWGQMDAISQTTFSNEFSWMKIHEFRLRFHWSLLAGQATSHYLNQWWLVYWRIYASLGLNELRRFGDGMLIFQQSQTCHNSCLPLEWLNQNIYAGITKWPIEIRWA